jgi:hypothetical protein
MRAVVLVWLFAGSRQDEMPAAFFDTIALHQAGYLSGGGA